MTVVYANPYANSDEQPRTPKHPGGRRPGRAIGPGSA